MGRLNDMRGLADTRNPMMKSPFESQSSQEKWNRGPSLDTLEGNLKKAQSPSPFDFWRRGREMGGAEANWNLMDPGSSLECLRGEP